MAEAISHTSTAKLLRTLTLWDLLLYGIVAVQPTAPMSVFGVLSVHGKGHVVTTILLALVAMLFTAVSYGKMARVYPSAGSAFTYVGQEINPAAGYITGWSMLMDYVINPIICVIWISHQTQAFVPEVPYWIWAVFTTFLLMLSSLCFALQMLSADHGSGALLGKFPDCVECCNHAPRSCEGLSYSYSRHWE